MHRQKTIVHFTESISKPSQIYYTTVYVPLR